MNMDLSYLKRAAVGGPFWCASIGILVGFLGCASSNNAPGDMYVASFATEPPATVLATHSANGWTVRNGDERILLALTANGDHRVPVFNGSWSGTWVGEVWEGVWTPFGPTITKCLSGWNCWPMPNQLQVRETPHIGTRRKGCWSWSRWTIPFGRPSAQPQEITDILPEHLWAINWF